MVTSEERNDSRISETSKHVTQESTNVVSPFEKNESNSPLQIQEEFSQSLIIPSNNDNILESLDETKQDVNDVVLQEQHSHIDEMPQHDKDSLRNLNHCHIYKRFC